MRSTRQRLRQLKKSRNNRLMSRSKKAVKRKRQRNVKLKIKRSKAKSARKSLYPTMKRTITTTRTSPLSKE